MDTRTSLFVVAMFALLIAWTWATSDHGLCSYGMVVDAVKNNGTTCAEFWFNRYQTLIAAIAAFSTAIIALAPARGQLRQMIAQAAHREIADLHAMKSDIEQLENAVITTITRISAAAQQYQRFASSPHRELPVRCAQASDACREAALYAESFPINWAKPWASMDLIKARDDFRVQIEVFASLSRNLDLRLRVHLDTKNYNSDLTSMTDLRQTADHVVAEKNSCVVYARQLCDVTKIEKELIDAKIISLTKDVTR